MRLLLVAMVVGSNRFKPRVKEFHSKLPVLHPAHGAWGCVFPLHSSFGV